MLYTVMFLKTDGRTKSGYKSIQIDIEAKDEEEALVLTKNNVKNLKNVTEIKIFETFVKRINFITKEEFIERFDTPSYCSPSSESYWSL